MASVIMARGGVLVDGERRPGRTSTELSPAFARTDKKSATSSSSSSFSSKGKANDASPLVALVVDQQEKCPRRTLSTKTEGVVRPQPFRCLSFPQTKVSKKSSSSSSPRRVARSGGVSRASRRLSEPASSFSSSSSSSLGAAVLWRSWTIGRRGFSFFFLEEEEEEEALVEGKTKRHIGGEKERKVHTFH